MEKFIIIDGNSLINRAYYALPPLRDSQGRNCNAVYGFVNILTKLIMEETPKYLCVTFDAGRKTFRNEMYAEYKATRKGMPEDLALQMPILKDLLKTMGIFIIEKLGIEADDLIGTLTKKFNDVQNFILTGDRDSLQLINQNTSVCLTKHGISEIALMNEQTLFEEWGLEPYQIIELKALMGDASDNIPGVAGVGEKTALDLLKTYKNVDNLYANIDEIKGKLREKLEVNKQMCYLSRALATIKCDVEIDVTKDELVYPFPWGKEVFDYFQKLEFRSLTRRTDIFDFTHKQEINVVNKSLDLDAFSAIINSQKNSDIFGFDIYNNELHFAFDKNNNYVVDMVCIDKIKVFDILKIFFENSEKNILTYNLKQLYKICDLYNINLKAKAYDVPLATYLINSNIKEDAPAPMLDYYGLPNGYLGTGIISAWEIAKSRLEEEKLTKLYLDIELPLVRVLYDMEKTGVIIDRQLLHNLAPKYRLEMQEITQRVYMLAGEEFNLNSPKQLATILFDKLHLPDANNKKHSTGVEVLQSLLPYHAIIEEILRYRKIAKLYQTYIEGLNQCIGPDGRIHTQFNQTITVTGRLSSNNPNLQNIPVRSEEGKELRKLFIASPGNVLVSADYSQIELRLLAHFSKDPVLLKAYEDGQDIHGATAASIFGVPIDKVTDTQRRTAKAVNFGIIYGISPYGLSQGLGISQKEAKEYIDRYFVIYPTIKQFLDSSVEEYKKTNQVTTLFGRIRKFDNVVPKSRDSRFSERAAMNMPLQGTASDIIKIAMLNVYNELKRRGLKSKLILQIHDELILDVPQNEVDEIVEIVRDKMENVIKLNVPLTVEIDVGKSWFDV